MICFWLSGHWVLLLNESEVILILVVIFLIVSLNEF